MQYRIKIVTRNHGEIISTWNSYEETSQTGKMCAINIQKMISSGLEITFETIDGYAIIPNNILKESVCLVEETH